MIRTISRNSIRAMGVRHSARSTGTLLGKVLTNRNQMRGYSLTRDVDADMSKYTVDRTASTSTGTSTDSGAFVSNNVALKDELLNTRIYAHARLPKTQEEYDLYEDIYLLILDRILPNIQEDGGNMEFRGFNFEEGIAYVKLTGACTSCSMSETTLKHGIENMLTYFIPEVVGVEQVFDPEEEIALKEFEKFEKKMGKN